MNDIMTQQGIPAVLAQAYKLVQEQGLPQNNAVIQQVYDSLIRNGTGEQLSTAQHFNNATSQFNDAASAFDRITQMLNSVPGIETSHVSSETYPVPSETSPVGTNVASGNGLRTHSSTTSRVQPGHPPRNYNTESVNSQVGNARNEGASVRARVEQPASSTQPTHSEVGEPPASEPDNDADDVRTQQAVATTPQVGTGDTGNPIDAMLALIPGFAAARAMQGSAQVQPTAPQQGGLPADNIRYGTVVREPRIADPLQLAAPPRGLPAPSTVDALFGNVPGMQSLEAPMQAVQVSTPQRAQIPSEVGGTVEPQKPVSVDSQGTARVGQRVGNQTRAPQAPSVVDDYSTVPPEQSAEARARGMVDRIAERISQVKSKAPAEPTTQPVKAQAASPNTPPATATTPASTPTKSLDDNPETQAAKSQLDAQVRTSNSEWATQFSDALSRARSMTELEDIAAAFEGRNPSIPKQVWQSQLAPIFNRHADEMHLAERNEQRGKVGLPKAATLKDAYSETDPVKQPTSTTPTKSTADSLADSVTEKTASSNTPTKLPRIQARDMDRIRNDFAAELMKHSAQFDKVTVDKVSKAGKGGGTNLVVKLGDQQLGSFKSKADLLDAVEQIAAKLAPAVKRLR